MTAAESSMPAVVAAADVIGRAGARQFEIGYLHDDQPTEKAGWYATAVWAGTKLIGEGAGPEEAADALAHMVLHGGHCTHCGGKVNTRPRRGRWQVKQCVWRRRGDRWVRGCEGRAA